MLGTDESMSGDGSATWANRGGHRAGQELLVVWDPWLRPEDNYTGASPASLQDLDPWV